MDWKFKLNGKNVVWKIEDDFVAVRPPVTQQAFEQALEVSQVKQGYDKNGYDKNGKQDEWEFKTITDDQQVFRQAGWKFVPRSQNPPDGVNIREVYISESGNTLISTNLATVRLRGKKELTLDEATKILKEDQLQIIRKLDFASNLYAVQLPTQQPLHEVILKLQARRVRYVFAEPSVLQAITGRLMPTDPQFGKQWQHAAAPALNGIGGFGLHSTDAWNITKGRGARPVRIAIIDNGMDVTHADLANQIIGGGFFRPDPVSDTAAFVRFQRGMTNFPIVGHGTFCMGMAAASQNNRNGGSGIAPEAELMAIACALDQTGTQLTLAEAIACAVNPRSFDPLAEPAGGADIISCSLETANFLESVLALAIRSAAREGRGRLGVPIFWAVNNRPTDISDDPICSLQEVIAVGRSNRAGKPDGSAHGPGLEFLAPGRRVFGPGRSDGNVFASGTSFATPLAAGVAALVLSRHSDWTVDQLRQHLKNSCDKIEGAHPHDCGAGRLNAHRAVQ